MPVNVPTQLAIANARINFFYPQIWKLEKFCWSNYGFYVQGLRTHSVIPEDGNLVAPDFPRLSASDQPFGWGPFLSFFPPTMMTALCIIPYQCDGHHPGFIVSFEIRLNGDLYRKQIAYGPHAGRETSDWTIIEGSEYGS